MTRWCVLALVVASVAQAEWKFAVVVDGEPVEATVIARKVQAPVGAEVECSLPPVDAPRGVSVASEHCRDKRSATKLFALAKAFKPAAEIASARTDRHGRGRLEVTGEVDVEVVPVSGATRGFFRVDTSKATETRLAFRSLDPADRTRESIKSWGERDEGKRAWAIAVDWPQVLSPDADEWFDGDFTPGNYVLITEDENMRGWFPVGQMESATRMQQRSLQVVKVTRGGQPVPGAQVVAVDYSRIAAREVSDARGTVSVPTDASSLFALLGKECATSTRYESELKLAPCTFKELRVVDEKGARLPNVFARFDEGGSYGSLDDGRLLVPSDAVGKVTFAAPGYRSEQFVAPGAGFTLKPKHRFTVRATTHDGVRVLTPLVSSATGRTSPQRGGLFEIDDAAPRVLVGRDGEPGLEVTLTAPVVEVTLPRVRELSGTASQEAFSAEVPLLTRGGYGQPRFFTFVAPPTWPQVWVRTCEDRKSCRLETVREDGTLALSKVKPVSWSVRVVQADGAVTHGGSVSYVGGYSHDAERAKLDQLGRAKLSTAPGWYWLTIGERDALEAGQWCLAGRECVMKLGAEKRASLVVTFADREVDGRVVRVENVASEVIDGRAELSLKPGTHQLIVDETQVLEVTLKAGQRLELPVTLPKRRAVAFTVTGEKGQPVDVDVGYGLTFGRYGGWSLMQLQRADAGQVKLEGWRGNVPLLISANGYEDAVVDVATLDGGVRLTPSRRVRLEHAEALGSMATVTFKHDYPFDVRAGMTELPLVADAGLTLPNREVPVQVYFDGWSSGARVVTAAATSLDVRRPAGKTFAAALTFGRETWVTVVPGVKLRDDEVRGGAVEKLPRSTCRSRGAGDIGCTVAGLPAGPATVLLDVPGGAGAPLVWNVVLPASGTVLLDPPANARVVR